MDVSADTIAALSTPPGRGALAVIRLTGDNAHEVFAEIIAEKEKFRKEAPRRIGIYTVIDTVYADTEVSDNVSGNTNIKINANRNYQLSTNDILRDDTTSSAVDEVTAVKYVAPRSYTGEDMVEIFCHGGAVIPEKISRPRA